MDVPISRSQVRHLLIKYRAWGADYEGADSGLQAAAYVSESVPPQKRDLVPIQSVEPAG
jgi:hypothetical protein